MCIRDRVGDGADALVLLQGLAKPLAEDPGDEGVLAELREPVSYTHLRAHETVLDLVCRLLLAKKKQTQNKTIHSSSTLYTMLHITLITYLAPQY